MLRVEIDDSTDFLILRLEGRFTGEDAEYTRTLTTRFAGGIKLLVDLTEVVFVDAVGEEVLSFLGQVGAEFVASDSYTLDVCERLNLPVAPSGNSRMNASEEAHPSGEQPRPNRSKARKR